MIGLVLINSWAEFVSQTWQPCLIIWQNLVEQCIRHQNNEQQSSPIYNINTLLFISSSIILYSISFIYIVTVFIYILLNTLTLLMSILLNLNICIFSLFTKEKKNPSVNCHYSSWYYYCHFHISYCTSFSIPPILSLYHLVADTEDSQSTDKPQEGYSP